jgi:hypothetical protein
LLRRKRPGACGKVFLNRSNSLNRLVIFIGDKERSESGFVLFSGLSQIATFHLETKEYQRLITLIQSGMGLALALS